MKRIYLCLAIGFLSTSCVNMSTLQTAEVLENGKGRTLIGGGYYTSPSLNEAIQDTTTTDEDLSVPYLELGYRRGVAEKLDVGVKLTLIGTLSADAKYELLNDGEFALAAGGGLGYVSLESGTDENKTSLSIIDFNLPLYASYRMSPTFALYTSPKFVYRMMSGGEDSDSASLFGATFGGQIGVDTGIATEVTFMKDTASDFNMLQVAFGFFF